MLILLQDTTAEVTIPEALLHTCISMAIVFAVLILISFIIYLLKFIPALFAAKEMKKNMPAPQGREEAEKSAATGAAVSAPGVAAGSPEEGGPQIIAVIAAAIAAQMSEETGAPVAPDGLVIRSIRRR